MEREDCQEHEKAGCDPVVEGSFFLQAMDKLAKQRAQQAKQDAQSLPAAPKVTDPNF